MRGELRGPPEKELSIEKRRKKELPPELQQAGEMFGMTVTAEREMEPPLETVGTVATDEGKKDAVLDPLLDRHQTVRGRLARMFGIVSLAVLSMAVAGCAEGKGPKREGVVDVPSPTHELEEKSTTYRVVDGGSYWEYDRASGRLLESQSESPAGKDFSQYWYDETGNLIKRLSRREVSSDDGVHYTEQTNEFGYDDQGQYIRVDRATRESGPPGSPDRETKTTEQFERLQDSRVKRHHLEKSERIVHSDGTVEGGIKVTDYYFDEKGSARSEVEYRDLDGKVKGREESDHRTFILGLRGTRKSYYDSMGQLIGTQEIFGNLRTTTIIHKNKDGIVEKIVETDYPPGGLYYSAGSSNRPGKPVEKVETEKNADGTVVQRSFYDFSNRRDGNVGSEMYVYDDQGNLIQIDVDSDGDGKIDAVRFTEDGEETPIDQVQGRK